MTSPACSRSIRMSKGPHSPIDKRKWKTLEPVPANAPAPPAAHYRHGKPTRTEVYRDAAGEPLGLVMRFDKADGTKEFYPLTFCEHVETHACEWRWQSWAKPRPLYGLDRLAARPTAPVVVTEGEKAADAAENLFPRFVGVTSPNGAKSAPHARWTDLAGRDVFMWPDADDQGVEYQDDVGRALKALGVDLLVITPPAGVIKGWDADDALNPKEPDEDAWDQARVLELVQAAKPWFELTPTASHGDNGDDRRRTTTSANLVDIVLSDGVELWHSPDGIPFATVPINDHHENWPLRSKGFRMWLTGRYFDHHETAPGGQALEDALRVLEGRAVYRGETHDLFVRIGESEGKVYLDLADDTWRAIEVRDDDWSVVDRAPVKFVRSNSMYPLPVPERGGMIERLSEFINCGDGANFHLVVAWLVGAFNPRGPFPLLAINGEQGSAKSTLSRMLRYLVDPNQAPIRSAPRDEQALMVTAKNSLIVALDNLSKIEDWLSDALCRLATGGGFAARELYTDFGEALFHAQRPILINGIPELTARPDLADRAIGVVLPPLQKERQRSEKELWRSFEAARPELLGALLDAVSSALRNADETATVMTRMADFATWVVAAETGLGWKPGTFVKAYEENRQGAILASLEADPIYEPLRKLMIEADRDYRHELEWTPTELLAELTANVSERVAKLRSWPSAQSLRGRLRRMQGQLRQVHHVELELDRRASGPDRSRIIYTTWPNGWFRRAAEDDSADGQG